MKVITMYLPQFHRVKENDEWWEPGYTEWTAVKSAQKQFEEHEQPRVPLNRDYYNLLERDVMQRQATLMQKYGVDGQCFYHYWFKDGRRILEKPAENLLRWKDINMPFCFCWANETWARSWSAIKQKTSWNDSYNAKQNDPTDGILLPQDYGTELEWMEHFQYLLPFFRDERYIQIENKPVFLIYKSAIIPRLEEMAVLWNELAIQNGFDGIYLIAENTNDNAASIISQKIVYEPNAVFAMLCAKNGLHSGSLGLYDYDDFWNLMLDYQDADSTTIHEAVVGFDDTPRRGQRGIVVKGQTPQKFREYFTRLLAKNHNNELVFLNAWNEWGEGMYLEPDEKSQYAYLEGINYAKEHYVEFINQYSGHERNSQIDLLRKQVDRYRGYWVLLDKWLLLKERNVHFAQYFQRYRIEKIAIYGMGMMGRHLYEELKESDVEVCYGIDQQGQLLSNEILIYKPEDDWPKVDAVVVAVTYGYEELVSRLQLKHIGKVMLLNDVIGELDETYRNPIDL